MDNRVHNRERFWIASAVIHVQKLMIMWYVVIWQKKMFIKKEKVLSKKASVTYSNITNSQFA